MNAKAMKIIDLIDTLAVPRHPGGVLPEDGISSVEDRARLAALEAVSSFAAVIEECERMRAELQTADLLTDPLANGEETVE